ncbi:hypothetical protein OIDMADRAFT_55783 [Oidiodendron maius Zn]|uniref:Uncharacterized protein n=1 Tax=Oidiodendron maius (strain Zn) TaxID=913774 RepID=A0A0C3GUW9_OIDMZ|nr:hypothetical protein OIDMADRAFT_55783 [Oidiodendron maius Zn]
MALMATAQALYCIVLTKRYAWIAPLYTRVVRTSLTGALLRLIALEIHHRLQQLDSLQILPLSIRRFLVDEQIPAASVTLVPELSASDFMRLRNAHARVFTTGFC